MIAHLRFRLRRGCWRRRGWSSSP